MTIDKGLVVTFFEELPVATRIMIVQRVEAVTSRSIYELMSNPKELFTVIESALGKHMSDLLLAMFLDWLKRRGIYATLDDIYRDVLN